MKNILVAAFFAISLPAIASENQDHVSKRIEFDKLTYIQAIQSENQSLLYDQVPVEIVERKTAKEEAKDLLIKIVELMDTIQKNGNRNHFSAEEHLTLSIELDSAINRVGDLNFRELARNINTEFNFFLLNY